MSNTSLLGSFGAQDSSSLMFRNRVINGDMRIDQRYNGAAFTNPLNAVSYVVDRFLVYGSQASKVSIQRNAGAVTPPVGFTNYLGATSLSAYSLLAGDAFLQEQKIEGFNVADLAWGTASAQAATISFWARSSLTGTFGGSVRNGAINRSYVFTYSISLANTWEYKTVTIPGDTSGTWPKDNDVGLAIAWSLGAGSSLSTAPGSWQAGNFISAPGAVSVVSTNGATLYLTGVQLEAGPTATPFERRPFGMELSLCQRYFERGSTLIFVTSPASTSLYVNGMANFKVSKRGSPVSLTAADAAGNAGRWSNFNAGTDVVDNNVNSVELINVNENAARVRYLYQPSGASTNNLFCFWTASLEL